MRDATAFSRRALIACAGAALIVKGPFRTPAAAAPQSVDPDALLDPELRPYLQGWEPPDITVTTLAAVRQQSGNSAPWAEAPVAFRQEIGGLPGEPPVSIIVIYPRHAKGYRPALLHLHGGGFVLGNAAMSVRRLQDVVVRHNCLAVLVDYRLAPEHPFPAALNDSLAALAWLHANASRLGVDSSRIAVEGESAGGGLAAALALAVRDRGGPPLAFQLLTYPMLDDRTAITHPVPAHVGTYAWTRKNNRFAWSAYLGVAAGSKHVPAGAVPSRASSVAGLPPAFIGVGGLDLFLGENIEYGRRLLEAGVPTELVVVPGAFHGFDLIAPETEAAREFSRRRENALGRRLRDS